MNPMENEAVLARLLQEAEGAIEIIDVKKHLEERHGLKYGKQ